MTFRTWLCMPPKTRPNFEAAHLCIIAEPLPEPPNLSWGVHMRQFRRSATLALLLAVSSFAQVNSGVKLHTYYVAADEVDWNYTPLGLDQMMGMPFT
jgi:hypothetical protein